MHTHLVSPSGSKEASSSLVSDQARGFSGAKHAPGPWELQEITHASEGLVYFVKGANALVQHKSKDTAGEANAALISAAPNLLAALRIQAAYHHECVQALGYADVAQYVKIGPRDIAMPAIESVHNAIKQAEGAK